MSGFGDLKYPADFKQFEYVNPNAPKGGLFSQIGSTRQFNQNFLTFNSLNSYIFRGDAALGMELTFATLMKRAGDEPDAMYGLAARAVRISSDGLTYRFLMRPEAKFHDGSRMTAHDVAWSLNLLKEKGHPIITQLMRDVSGRRGDRRRDRGRALRAGTRPRRAAVRGGAADLLARLLFKAPVRRDARSRCRSAPAPTRSASFEVGRFIEYDRVKDWWGADLPVSVGHNNFDVAPLRVLSRPRRGVRRLHRPQLSVPRGIHLAHLGDALQFPGDQATAASSSDVLPDDTPSGAQGWFFNTRREKFKNRLLREALILAFDFEWTNKSIMYGSYDRTHSVFQNSNMMAAGGRGPTSLRCSSRSAARCRTRCSASRSCRRSPTDRARTASCCARRARCLQKAGFPIKDGRRVMPNGERISIEFLIDEPSFQPHHMPYIKNLGTLGIDANLRIVDPVQYRRRVDDFDFDITVQRFSFSTLPGDSLRSYFTSQAAAIKGSQNLAGIADPVVDALVDKIIAADSRPALVTACKALDRVIRAGRYWVPHWYKASHWIAYWDVFGRPPAKPRYARGIPETWWYDRDRAAKTPANGMKQS